MRIREEASGDAAAIRRVIVAAFGRQAEADLVDALRSAGDAAVSLVAEDDTGIVGHVLFSKLQAPDGCVALAPVSVTPGRQSKGIGTALVREGLERAKRDGARAAFVVGEPGYYGRFGFRPAAQRFETTYPRSYFMALELAPGALGEASGPVNFAPAFASLDEA